MPQYQIYLSKQAQKYVTNMNKKQANNLIQQIKDLKNHPFYTQHHDIATILN